MRMRKYGLVVGVGAYDDPEISDLPFAVADAEAVATCLRNDCNFDEVVTLVSGGTPAPDHTAVLDALFRFAPRLTPDDLFFFYFAGHGVETASGTFLLTRNARLRMPQVASLQSAVLSEALAHVACRDRVLVLDACRNDPRRARGDAGNVMSAGFSRDIMAVAQAPAAEVTPATCVLFSCRAGERAYEWPDVGQGAFTHFLVEGMRGAARDERGRLTVQGLGRFVEERVPVWARQTMKPLPQTPWSEQTGSLREIVLDAGQQRPSALRQPAPRRGWAGTPNAEEHALSTSVPFVPERPVQAAPPAPLEWPDQPPTGRPLPRNTIEPGASSPALSTSRGRRIPLGRLLRAALAFTVAVGAIWLATRWHQAGMEHLQRTADHLTTGSLDDATVILATSTIPPWLQPTRGRLQREATDLTSARTAEATGDVATVHALTQTYPGDARFAAALQAARVRAAPTHDDQLATRAPLGDDATVLQIIEWYADSGVLIEEIQAALQALRSFAGTAASRGDTATVDRIAASFPDDTGLARIATEARQVAAERERQLALAREAAHRGDVDATTRHTAAYPDDPDFSGLIGTAERARDRIAAVEAAEAAAAQGDVETIRVILTQYPEDAIREALQEAQAIALRRETIQGLQRALDNLDYQTALSIVRTYAGARDDEIVELLDRVGAATLVAAEAALADWRVDDALRLLAGHSSRSPEASALQAAASQRSMILEWEKEFGPFPMARSDAAVTWNDLQAGFDQRAFDARKVLVVGTVASRVTYTAYSDTREYRFAVDIVLDGSDGQGRLRLLWQLDRPSGLGGRDWLSDQSRWLQEFDRLGRGQRCVAYGMYEPDRYRYLSSPPPRHAIRPVEFFRCL